MQGGALPSGRLGRLSDVRVVPARAVRVRGEPGEAMQADGDLAATLPLAVTLAEAPLALITAS